MKKYFLLVACIFSCGAAEALPVGNPAEPMLFTNHFCFETRPCWDSNRSWCDFFNVRFGFYGDYVLNRRLEAPSDQTTLTEQQTIIYTNAGEFVLNICNRLDLFATIGATRFEIIESTTNATGKLDYYYTPTVSYSGGGRLALYRCGCFYLGLEGQYFYTRAELDSFTAWDLGNFVYFDASSLRDETYNEWQAAVAVSYQFQNSAGFSLIPYAAIQFSGINWSRRRALTDSVQVYDLQQQELIGWTLGVTALLCDIIDITAEARWANERAFSVTGQISF